MNQLMKSITSMILAGLWSVRTVVATVIIIIIAIVAFNIGARVGGPANGGDQAHAEDEGGGESNIKFWTCAMHPQIQQPGTGTCPICFMDLIPVRASDTADPGPRAITMSEEAIRLAQIQTQVVERRTPTAEVRLVGKIEYDETKMSTITAYFPGRLDRLYVDYTGITVQKGDHLAEIYSPDLLAAQQELIQAKQSAVELRNSDSEFIRKSGQTMVNAAREKLRLWGLTPIQIQEIEDRGTTTDHVTIYAPISGIVVHKNAMEGMYVKTGSPIYTLADLSVVWVQLDAYESDLPWIRYGQDVEFTTDSVPGKTFFGRISFVDPVLNTKTRTVNVRVNVDNTKRTLKPGMFVRAIVRPIISTGGRVVDTALKGKWISPMHPEVIKDEPGDCDVCGMDLVRAEDLGFITDTEETAPPVVIPVTAALITGKRAIVYVLRPDTEKPTFEGRVVVLGPRAGEVYLVESGLETGEVIAIHGAFRIDSSLQIAAKTSMMLPEENKEVMVDQAFLTAIEPVYAAYFNIWQALAGDDLDAFRTNTTIMQKAVENVNASTLTGEAVGVWRTITAQLLTNEEHIEHATDFDTAHQFFETYSLGIIELAERLGHTGDTPYHRAYCPMAFDNAGASWLQTVENIQNPYFEGFMKSCGSIEETFSTRATMTMDEELNEGEGGRHDH